MSNPWAVGVTQSIGAEIRGHRLRQKMTVQALAGKCTELGLPLGRVTITKLETGSREHVSVPELLVLGAALDVPPLALVFPPPAGVLPAGLQHQAEVLPGRLATAQQAARWFAGVMPSPLLGDVRALVGRLSRLVGANEGTLGS